MDRLSRIKQILKTLPEKPGVYKHLDKDGQILYIGKAKNLKKRVSSYFSKTHDQARLRMLVRRVESIDVIITETEYDALLLENTLIKQHQPWYNINLKDGKTYPWICIKKERFPRVFSTRQRIEDGSEYFGPYPSGRMLATLLDLIRQLYPLRTCALPLTESAVEAGKYRICLEFQMHNCLGPCEARQTEAEYLEDIASVRRLLKGEWSSIKHKLHGQMMMHAASQSFEHAQAIKEKLALLEKYQAKSTVLNPHIGEVDVYSVVDDVEYAYVNFLMVREGAVIQSYTLEIKKKLEETPAEMLELTIPEIRLRFGSEAKHILLSHEVDLILEGAQWAVPQRGDKAAVVALSSRNARAQRLERLKNMQIIDPDRHVNRIMAQMKLDLRLSEEPRHLECFDNSNIQGTHPVSACVVFRNGKPAKKDYRHFHVKTVEGPDDFATMEEVVYRRYKRMLDEGQSLPQLILIDGGKGQLSASVAALEKLGLRGKVAILGIAKRLEELYFPGDSVPLYLDKRSETLKILQQARNEAHRFGITFHRNTRSKAGITSALATIPGVGPATLDVLLTTFKSAAGVKRASAEALEQAVGPAKAKKVIAWVTSQEKA
ncbi:MAG: excinuclease ABC subunit C [Cryomorphaceae bacterium BACL7 MAG-120910-bin2]|jgi:excinuclease ABC subunit C|nr:MAG: excinuclease ABC subunit C [Cryomorphaceae bacterium BACL7 MAG-120910-bin2]KRO68240.1 MAG: excinuclease ABC subunit C [Cryomorphaceae bacterium BACL7 MAG-120322-bin74]KRO83911.1 MAG: excinuclease ABC subunit C [Cryomorphaceae bacterium BACL7 MAG-121220-bin83]